MSKLEITGRASVDRDAAIVGLANHRLIFPDSAATLTRPDAELALESVFTGYGERGLDLWLPGADDYEAWAQEQVDRLWPDLRPNGRQAAA